MKDPEYCSMKECVEIIGLIERAAEIEVEPYKTRFDEIFELETEDESQSTE